MGKHRCNTGITRIPKGDTGWRCHWCGEPWNPEKHDVWIAAPAPGRRNRV